MARRVSGKKIAKSKSGARSPASKSDKQDKSRGARTVRRRAATARTAAKGGVYEDSDQPEQMSASELVRKIREEIWPVERKVLFKPDRLRYVRKMIKSDGCVFCSAVKAGPGVESLLVFSNEHAIVVLNKYPYNTGHLLILPRRHTGEFTELTEVELHHINVCLQRSLRALKEIYQPAGFNVGLNLGAAAGAGIPEHLHYHVIPRWNGDTNFFPLIADTKVVVETLEQTFQRLIPYFEGQ